MTLPARAAARFRRGVIGVAPTIVFAILASGCIDLVPVAPPPARPAVLHLFLRLTQPAVGPTGPVPVAVSAILDPGVDESGRTRLVSDDRLMVAGQILEPVETLASGAISYLATVPIDRNQLLSGTFSARAPNLYQIAVDQLNIQWPLGLRLDPDPILHPRGTPLVIRIGYTGLPGSPVPTGRRWSVSGFGGNSWFSRGGDGLPPTELTIPVDLISAPNESLVAIVNITQSSEVGVGGGEYVIRLELSQELRWDVVIDG